MLKVTEAVPKVMEAAESVSGNPSPPTNISKANAALVFILMSFLKPNCVIILLLRLIRILNSVERLLREGHAI